MSKLFLLSLEEVRKIPQDILALEGGCWWLRSPGFTTIGTAYVSSYGCIFRFGDYVYTTYCVRLAIRLTSDTSNLIHTKKGYIKFGRELICNNLNLNCKPIKWIDISDYVGFPCLLMKKVYQYRRFDAESNIYEKSEIFEYLKNLDAILFTDEEKVMIEDFGGGTE